MIELQRKLSAFFVLGMLMLSTTFCAQAQIALEEKQDRLFASPEDIYFYSSEWDGERLDDGRPMVDDDLLERLKNIKVEDVWQFLNEAGYRNQFEGGWKMIHDDEPITGRVMTAQYAPSRPDIEEKLTEIGQANGFSGPMNTWPIDVLQDGDVYVADGFGKIEQGTLIGDKLGNTIFGNSGNGVIFDGALRDVETLRDLDGFNAFSRGWSPTFLEEVMLSGVNVPIRIGDVKVMPGDVVLAKEMGVVFIPPHLVEDIVITAEIVMLRDRFVHVRVQEGVYTAGQVDQRWTQEMEDDFEQWVREDSDRMDLMPVPFEEMQNYLEHRTW